MCVYVYIYHIFIHSSVDKHIGCFHILAIVNSAAVNIGMHVSFELVFFFFLGLQDHIATPFFILWGTSVPFSTVAVPVYIPTSSVGGLPFSTPSPRTEWWLLYSQLHKGLNWGPVEERQKWRPWGWKDDCTEGPSPGTVAVCPTKRFNTVILFNSSF